MPRYNQPRKTWQYTKDFEVKAVKLSLQAGIQVKQVAEGLDIHPFMLSRWRKEHRDGKLQGGGQRRVGVNSLKGELIRGNIFNSRGTLRNAVAGYINRFYNTVRLYSGLEYMSPIEYE